MQSSNLSVLDVSIVVKIGSLVVPIDSFDPSSAIFQVADRQTADGELTPDGYFTFWGLRKAIETTFTTTGASKGGKVLTSILNSQAKGNLAIATIVIKNYDYVATLGPGILTTGKPMLSFGSEKLEPLTFNFKFGDIL